MKILAKPIIYKTYLEKRKKKQNKRVDTNIVNTCIFINRNLQKKIRLGKLQNSQAPDLQILRMYIEEGAETSVKINDTLIVYS